jgi:hypothetical protein
VSSRNVIADWEASRKYPRKGAAVLEEVLGITLGGPRCGRPEGHNGPCRPVEAVARYRRADMERQRRASRERRRSIAPVSPEQAEVNRGMVIEALAEQRRERRRAA